jgi:serine/threonine protein kinase
LQQGRIFTESETKQIAKALLRILIYLHGKTPPIVHRDIKPSNILLANRHAHLVDFGSVKAITGSGDTNTFTVVGTYGYMPPEQFSGRAVPASDLYSLGATLITLMTGIHPSSLPRKGVKVDFEKIASFSPAFADWLGWLTEASLDRRVQSAQEALQALDEGRKPVAAIAPVIKPSDSKISVTSDPNALDILIPSLLGQTSLHIDQQLISMTSKRLGFQSSRPQVGFRQEISKLEYRSGADEGDTQNNDAQPSLILWVGSQKYELGDNPPLTEPELAWLAYELSSWLNLPIR